MGEMQNKLHLSFICSGTVAVKGSRLCTTRLKASPIDIEGDIRTARTTLCTARAPRVRFYQPFPAFFTFFQGGKDAVA